jgi:hypothetical protein
MAEQPAGPSPDFDVRDVIDGVALLASTANVVMQLERRRPVHGEQPGQLQRV